MKFRGSFLWFNVGFMAAMFCLLIGGSVTGTDRSPLYPFVGIPTIILLGAFVIYDAFWGKYQ